MKNFWDERFSADEYVYGKAPNEWFRSVIDTLEPGKLLIPGEGEGRNAVYASFKGWSVHAYDSSVEGRKKALKLAKEVNVEIEYEINDYLSFQSDNIYDAIALIFNHMPSEMRTEVHRKYVDLLKPGGHLILQAFSKEQLGLKSGGPKEIDLLFSIEDLKEDFSELTNLSLEIETVELDEGPFHKGLASVVTLLGIK